jgi:predicted dehydrogenase
MVKIGIIGAGTNASGHARYYATCGRSKVVWVMDPLAARAQSLAKEVGARPLDDFRWGLSDVDAVIVASPNPLHRDQAVAAADAGKHLYCEKPMGMSLLEAREIASAVNRAKVKSQVGFAVRFGKVIQQMEQLSRAGTLGPIVAMWSRRLVWMDPAKAPGWRADPVQSGGVLMEVNIHELEWMLHLGGPVESVYSVTRSNHPHPRANDHLWFVLRFRNGATGMHEGSWLSSEACFGRGVRGTDAAAFTDEWGTKLFFARQGLSRDEYKVTTPDLDPRSNFLDAIERNTPTLADANWGLKVMAVAEAILESAASGQPAKPAE